MKRLFKLLFTLLLILSALVLVVAGLYAALIFTRGGGAWICGVRGAVYPYDQITGSVTIIEDSGAQTVRFSDPGGKGGYYIHTGTEEVPVEIAVTSKNVHFLIDIDLTVSMQEGGSAITTATVRVDGYEPFTIRDSFQACEAIRVLVNCFP